MTAEARGCEAGGMRRICVVPVVFASLAACGADDAPGGVDAPSSPVDAAADAQPTPDAPSIDAPPAALTLTSTVITEGGVIPDMYSCQGTNVSPPLSWSGGPSAAGYAVVLTDRSNNLVHSIIWDIPGTVTSLPENVSKVAEPPTPAGSKQPPAYDNQTRGYLGPCPGSMHTYEFMVYAVDEHPLTGVTLSSNRTAVRSALMANMVATATLTATFTP